MIVAERSQVVLLTRGPDIAVYPEVGSANLTVRSQARRYLAVLVKNASAIAKLTGLTRPAGF